MAKRQVHKVRASIEVSAKIPEDDTPVIPDNGFVEIKILKGTKIFYENKFEINHKNYDIFDKLGVYLLDLTEELEKTKE